MYYGDWPKLQSERAISVAVWGISSCKCVSWSALLCQTCTILLHYGANQIFLLHLQEESILEHVPSFFVNLGEYLMASSNLACVDHFVLISQTSALRFHLAQQVDHPGYLSNHMAFLPWTQSQDNSYRRHIRSPFCQLRRRQTFW